MANKEVSPEIQKLLDENNLGIKLDIGCGASKQKGFVGMDIRPLPGVDVVHDLERFPWPFPDQSVSFAMSSHVLEHIYPGRPDARLVGLLKLLLAKGSITQDEVDKYIGEIDPGPVFARFMDEVWRVMKYDGQFVIAMPYGFSQGMLQDPTHVNARNQNTWRYFDPLDPVIGNGLYRIYEPAPWKRTGVSYNEEGNMEILLEKRRDDPSYHADKKIHFE
jgi:hypothetical protein